MVRHHFGALPVMDGDQLVGIITELDLLRHFVAACRGGWWASGPGRPDRLHRSIRRGI